MLVKRVDYTILKTAASSRSASVQWVDYGDFYWLGVIDGSLTIETHINKVTQAADVTDFETNLKPAGNKPFNQSSPFGSKTLRVAGVEKKIYARSTGIRPVLAAGANQIDFTITYPWCKILGIEAINAEALDYTDLKIIDRNVNPYLGVPDAVLNQFAFANNIAPNFYIRLAQFDADLYEGMIIRFNYNSVSAKTIGINFILYEVKS